MGNSESKAQIKTQIKNKVLNQTSINKYSETVNENITKNMTDVAQSCGASAGVSQVIKATDITFKNVKGAKIDFSQTATVTFDFSCTQVANVINDMQDKMIKNISDTIDSSTDTDLLNQIKDKMVANAKTEPLAFGGASSSTESDTSVENEIKNRTDINIHDVVKNITKNEFETNIVNNCLATAQSYQEADFSGLVVEYAEDIEMNFAQTAIVSMVADCVQEANVGNKVIKRLADLGGIMIKDDKKSGAETKKESESESSAEASGLLQAFSGLKGNKLIMAVPLISSSLSFFLSIAALGAFFVMNGGLDELR